MPAALGKNLPHVKIDQFEGPFDLLLELVASRKLDISTISLSQITQDFLHYVSLHTIDPLLRGDFLLVAATLVALKARSLLPEAVAEEEEDMLETVTARLRIYEMYRQQALRLYRHWNAVRLLPAHFWAETTYRKQLAPLAPISLETITVAMETVLRHIPQPAMPTRHLVRQGRSLEQCLKLWEECLTVTTSVPFHQAIKVLDRQDIALSLLAALELQRQGRVRLEQKQMFDTLHIHKR